MNFFSVLKHIYKTGGIRNFYSGMSLMASGCMPAHAIYFSVYEYARAKLKITDESHNPHLYAITGAIATFLHDLILTPFDGILKFKWKYQK
jgi:solute carrier family 25 iron transporter 28/37